MIKTKEDLAYYKRQDAIINGFVNKNNFFRGVKQRLNKRFKFLKLLREAEYYKIILMALINCSFILSIIGSRSSVCL